MQPNPVVWFEIYTQDIARARAFYESVFQTTLERLPGGALEMWTFPMKQDAGGAGATAFVSDARDNFTFHFTGTVARVGTLFCFPSRQCRAISLEPFKKCRVTQQPVFHHFAIPGNEITRRQCAQHINISKDQIRLVKRPNQIFTLR